MTGRLSPRGTEAAQMKIRFIRYEEAPNYFEMEEKLLYAYAKAAGAVYKLAKIKLIKVEILEEYMKHLTKVGRTTKLIQRKYVRVGEGTLIYNIGRHRFIEMARAAGAVYKVGMSALINTEIFEEYLEQFRENPIPLPKHIVDKSRIEKKTENIFS